MRRLLTILILTATTLSAMGQATPKKKFSEIPVSSVVGAASFVGVDSTVLGSPKDVRYTISDLANYLATGLVPSSRTITINGTTLDLSANRSWTVAGGVTGITFSSPLTGGTITTTGTVGIPAANGTTNGYLSSTDWLTFNGKQSLISLTTTGSSGAATFVANTLNIPTYTATGLGAVPTTTSVNTTAPLTGGGALSSSLTLSMPYASGAADGYLKQGDWTTFNNKVSGLTVGNLSPVFTASVTTSTTTPAITYTLTPASAYTVLCNTTNAGAAPAYSKIDVGNMVFGNLPVTNLNSGTSASSATFWRGDGTWSNALGSATATTQSAGDNSTKVATTAYVDGNYKDTTTTSFTTSMTPTIPASVKKYIVQYNITAQAGALLFNAPGTTMANGQVLIISIKDNGTARALTYNAIYRAGSDVALPSTTTLGKNLYLEFMYNANDGKMDLIGKADGF